MEVAEKAPEISGTDGGSNPITGVVSQSPEINQVQDVRDWLNQIEQARRREKTFRKEALRILEIYEGTKKDTHPFNILYSNTEVLCPAVYSQPPRPRVVRRFTRQVSAGADPGDGDALGKAASEASQRMLSFLMDTNSEEYPTFDTAMKHIVQDAVLPGRGVMEFCYDAQTAPGDQSQGIPEQVTEECIYSNPLEWNRAYFGFARKWTDVPWVALELYYDKSQATAEFGEELALQINYVPETTEENEDDTGRKSLDEEDQTNRKVACIFKIFDKRSKCVRFVSPNFTRGYLKVIQDPFKLTGFYPIPTPLQFIRKTTKLVPTALYTLYEDQARELNKVTVRLSNLISACKVRGLYDASLNEIEELLKKEDNTLLPAGQASTLHRGEGLEKYIWLVPIEKIVTVIQQMYLAREQIKQVIYEVMGLADIMRGATKASETLGAQELKSQWGSLRLKSMQKDVANFSRESMRIMLEMAINLFRPDTWAKATQLDYLTPQQEQMLQTMQTGMQQAQMTGASIPPQIAQQVQEMSQKPTWRSVLQLLRDKLQREYRIDIETNSTLDTEATQDKQSIAELMNAMSQFLNGVGPLVQSGVLDIGAAKGILLAAVRRFEFGSEVEDYIRNMKPPQPQQDPAKDAKLQTEQMKAQADSQRVQMELERDRQKHQNEMEEIAARKSLAQVLAQIKLAEANAKLTLVLTKASARGAGVSATT